MFKKILTFIMLIFIIIGVAFGIYFGASEDGESQADKFKNKAIFGGMRSKHAEVTEFFTYGKCFNLSGKLLGISKDNFESAKLYITNGDDFEMSYKIETKIKDGVLQFSTTDTINAGLILDDLPIGQYVVLLRIKTNNSVNPKFYSLVNTSQLGEIEYYTITKGGSNNKVNVGFKNKIYEEHDYSYLAINVEETELPSHVYDIVIDAGHGGKDKGEKKGTDTEADIALAYAKSLKTKLEACGFKVKLTRDDINTDTYTTTNMYDANGRITSACETKAKYMISLHLNNGNTGLKGVEIYAPCKSNLQLAHSMAHKVITYTNVEFSNNNSFKQADGVYVRNFTQSVINEFANTANKKGYEPYNITLETPYLYTIREVGGIATNAYVDGRNTAYSANKYYKSNQGIECYQIEMGYIKNDLEIIKSEMEEYTTAIADSIIEFEERKVGNENN